MSILILGKTPEICESIAQLLTEQERPDVTALTSGAAARGLDISAFDGIIVSTPLSDEFGLDFTADIARSAKNGIVVLAKREIADEVQKKIRFTGALVLARPFNKALLMQTLRFAEIAHGSMAKLEQENRELNKQIAEMKLINRAKSMLMQYLSLTEEQAHRQIQKRAMDMRKPQSEIAEEILKTYQNNTADKTAE